MGAEDEVIKDFERETGTYIDAEKQIQHEERQSEWDLELQNYIKDAGKRLF